MCGIVGIVNLSGLTKDDMMKFTVMLAKCQSRGYDATGVFNDAFEFRKAPLPSQVFVKSDKYVEWVQGTIGKKYAIGHCRQATRGSAEKNENNHPIPIGNGLLKGFIVHNGIVNCKKWDFDTLRGKDGEKTDTFIFSNAIEHFMDPSHDFVDDVTGAFDEVNLASSSNDSVIVVGNSSKVVFCKSKSRPMFIQEIIPSKKFIFASEPDIMEPEINKLEGEKKYKIYERMENDSFFCIDLSNGSSVSGFLKSFKMPVPLSKVYQIDSSLVDTKWAFSKKKYKKLKGKKARDERKNKEEMEKRLNSWRGGYKARMYSDEKRFSEENYLDEVGEIEDDFFKRNCIGCIYKGKIDEDNRLLDYEGYIYCNNFGYEVQCSDAEFCPHFVLEEYCPGGLERKI